MHKAAWSHGHAPREEVAASQEMRPAAHDLRHTMTHLDIKQKLRWSQKFPPEKKKMTARMDDMEHNAQQREIPSTDCLFSILHKVCI